VTGIEWMGVTVDRLGGHQLFPLSSKGEATGKLSADLMTTRYGQVLEAVGSQSPERTEPPTPSGLPVTLIPRD
ncbi:MAG TPA: hypothetical protein VK030_06370, partial [Actinomycetales bacterium]|nr:hypothetical protein [Actinomycetales bacterium]